MNNHLLHISPTWRWKMRSLLELRARRKSPSVKVPMRRLHSSTTMRHPHPLLVSSTSWSIIRSLSLHSGSALPFLIISSTFTHHECIDQSSNCSHSKMYESARELSQHGTSFSGYWISIIKSPRIVQIHQAVTLMAQSRNNYHRTCVTNYES